MGRSWERGKKHSKDLVCISCGWRKDYTAFSKGKGICKECVKKEEQREMLKQMAK